jgi:CubicO group peptidase (beta-lactamase class C family)
MIRQSKNKLIRLIITVFALSVLLAVTAPGQLKIHDKIAEIVEAESQYDLFSGTVLVAKDGKVIYAKGFGKANKEYGIPNMLETKFNISSIQKTFVAALIMKLCQEGVISLDDAITTYFPECPWKSADQIHIKNLLNHTTGLADYRDNNEYRANMNTYKTIDDVLPLVFKLVPDLDTTGRIRYSNAGVLLAKSIIEKVTKKRFNEALKEMIIDPLGMDQTAFLVEGDVLNHRATAYEKQGEGMRYKRRLDEPSAYTGGGIYTTCLDLYKFDQALYGGELLSQEFKDIMFTPNENNSFAQGWIVVEFGGTTVIYHGGQSGGFSSEFRRYPEIGYTLIVLSNYDGAAYSLANKLDCMLLGLPYTIATEYDRDFQLGLNAQEIEDYEQAIAILDKNVKGHPPLLAR